MKRIILAMLAALTISTAQAGELAGVTLPDTATLGGQSLVLNGMALREKYFLDIYVGGLYLPAKTTDGATAINQDVAKKIEMSFIYSEVPAEKTIETYREVWALDPNYPAVQAQAETFCSWITTLHSGETMTIQYVPGEGTSLLVNGAKKGTIPGVEFMRVIFSNYLGPHANKVLRTGMLGK
ncbi:MAG: chalcone isomerase family protein [Pseudomonadota bacterium]